jgi:hypothetical protein
MKRFPKCTHHVFVAVGRVRFPIRFVIHILEVLETISHRVLELDRNLAYLCSHSVQNVVEHDDLCIGTGFWKVIRVRS